MMQSKLVDYILVWMRFLLNKQCIYRWFRWLLIASFYSYLKWIYEIGSSQLKIQDNFNGYYHFFYRQLNNNNNLNFFLLFLPGECKSKTLPRIHFDTTLSSKHMNNEGKFISCNVWIVCTSCNKYMHTHITELILLCCCCYLDFYLDFFFFVVILFSVNKFFLFYSIVDSFEYETLNDKIIV